MNGQENYDSEIDYPNVQFTAPQQEQQKFITSLNTKFQKNTEKQTGQVHTFLKRKTTSHNNLLQQILTYRFINALRVKSGNVSIDSVQAKHISILNDLSANPKYYLYKGSSISRLIKQQQEKTNNHLKISILGAIFNQLPLMQPNSKTSMILDFISLLVTLFQLIQVPLILSFDVDILILQYAIYFYLTIDSFRAIFTGVYIDGNLVVNKRVIFTRHLKSQFLVDSLTIYQYWIFQEQYFLRLLFLIRFAKVNEILNKLEIVVNLQNQNLITLTKSIFLMVFSTHLMCCFQNMIQQATDTKWQSLHPMGNAISLQYLQGLYWAVQTMVSVGYGDVPPLTDVQKIYTTFIMFIGICLFSFVMNSIGNVINLLNENRKNHTKFKIEYETYYKSKPLKQEVFQKIRDYNEIAFEFHQTSSNYGKQLLEIVSEELRIEYLEQINGKIIRNNVVFSKFSPQLQRYVIDHLHEQFYLPTDLIATDTSELFILNKGSVKLAQKAMTLEVFSQADVCLNIINFIINENEKSQFISINHTLIYRLEKLQLINPSDKELFQFIKDDLIFNKNYRAVGLGCSGCFSPLHLFKNCPEIHFCANREKILKSRQTQGQARQFFCRIQLHKINTFRLLEKTQINAMLFIEDVLNNSEENLLPNNPTVQKLSTQQLDFPQQKSSLTVKIDTFANIGLNSSNMIQLSSQCVNSTASAFDSSNQEIIIDFEHVYEFKTYFPHGNISNIIKQVNQHIRKPRLRRIQTIFRTGVLKIVAQEELDTMKQKIHKRKNKLEIDRNLISQLQLLGQNSRRSRTFNLQRFETTVNDI